jgi:O-antigen ligase
VYFVARYRWKGLLLGLVFALPVLLYGGRSDSDAQESTEGRLGVQMDGIQMFISHPLMGVGYGRFVENSSGTAHNSFVLTPAELGAFGMVTWCTVFWISFRSARTGLRNTSSLSGSEAQIWGMCVLSTLSGLASGVAFLSFNFHFVLWILFGMSGAYYRCVIADHPEAAIRIRLREVVLVALGNLGLIAFLFAYVRAKGLR